MADRSRAGDRCSGLACGGFLGGLGDGDLLVGFLRSLSLTGILGLVDFGARGTDGLFGLINGGVIGLDAGFLAPGRTPP